jgi:hypothetical protein
VTDTEDRLTGLRAVCPEAYGLCEGGKDYIVLPRLKITTDGEIVEMDALLRPGEHSGYRTRLFLAHPLPGKGHGGAWTSHSICGRTWHTWSWNNVPETLAYPQMLLGHLWALR